MFSQTSEYALRVIVYLAGCNGDPATNRVISSGTMVPQGYLAKVLQTLSRAGLVKSQRGLHGGTVLAKDPNLLTLFDVVQAVDPIRRIESCPLAVLAHGKQLCPLHTRLDQAIGGIETVLRTSTIADLMASKSRHQPLPLCEPQPVHPKRKKVRAAR
jgi:Rrf2 family protein